MSKEAFVGFVAFVFIILVGIFISTLFYLYLPSIVALIGTCTVAAFIFLLLLVLTH